MGAGEDVWRGDEVSLAATEGGFGFVLSVGEMLGVVGGLGSGRPGEP